MNLQQLSIYEKYSYHFEAAGRPLKPRAKNLLIGRFAQNYKKICFENYKKICLCHCMKGSDIFLFHFLIILRPQADLSSLLG